MCVHVCACVSAHVWLPAAPCEVREGAGGGGRELPVETSFTESVCFEQPEAQEINECPPLPTSLVLDFTWPSALAVANLFPSGENRTQLTKRPWSCRKRDD